MTSSLLGRCGPLLFLFALQLSCGTMRAPNAGARRAIGAFGTTGAERDWSRALRRQVLAYWNSWDVTETEAFGLSSGPPLLTLLRMRIRADGTVQDLRIIHASGNAALDQDAVAAVKNAGPLPAPPSALVDGTGAVDFDLGFRVYYDEYPATAEKDEEHDPFALIFAAPDRQALGTVDREAIIRFISQNTDPARCARESATTYPVGNATIRLQITESGNVNPPVVVRSTGLNRPLEACLLQAMSRWSFAPPRGSRAVVRLRVSFFAPGPGTQPGGASLALEEEPASGANVAQASPLPAGTTRQPASIVCQPSNDSAGSASAPSPPEAPPSVGLDKEVIRKAIQQHTPAVRDCYDKRMIAPPYPEGKLTTRFSIDFDGHVRSSCVVASTVTDPSIDVCIVDEILTWQFPKPNGGGWVVVQYPFVLTPGD